MDIRFQEIQYFPEPTFALAIGLIFHVLILYRRIPLLVNVIAFVLLLPILLLPVQLETVLDDQVIQIRYGGIPLIQRIIPLDQITRQKAVAYVHMDHTLGVWQDEQAIPPFVPRGEQALLLELKDGSRHLIHSRRITELQQVIEEGRNKSGDRV